MFHVKQVELALKDHLLPDDGVAPPGEAGSHISFYEY